MGEGIERIAKEVERRFNESAARGPFEWPTYFDVVRFALEALREPTDEMIAAANRLNHPSDGEIWQAMIDNVLKDGDRADTL